MMESNLDHPTSDLAHLMTTMVFRIWRGSLPENASLIKDFHSFVIKIISSTAPNVTPSVLLTALYFVRRLRIATRRMGIPSGNRCEFRIWLTALMLADAYLNDNAFTASSWAKVSGFSSYECATMRREFLISIRYDLHVTESQYSRWLFSLEKYLGLESLVLPSLPVSPPMSPDPTVVYPVHASLIPIDSPRCRPNHHSQGSYPPLAHMLPKFSHDFPFRVGV